MDVEYKNCVLNQDRFFKFLGYAPHPGQLTVHNSNDRFRVLACGRRWGKSLSSAHEIAKYALLPNQMLWCVAPTYDLADKVFREVYKIFTHKLPHWIESKSESRMVLKLYNGTQILGKSADNPDSLIGEGVTGMVIDEAARIKKSVWEESIFPTLTDKKGWCLIISTPRGRNWFNEIFLDGQDRLVTDTMSKNFPSVNNPHLDPAEIARAKKKISSRAYEQEYEAQFLDDAGGVFRGVRECISGELMDGEGGVNYIMGVDLAKYTDFTVIIVIDTRNNHVCYFDRFNQIDWTLQKERIKNISEKYGHPQIHLDATGIGDAIFEDLQSELNVIGHKYDNKFKNKIIDNLAMMIERKELSFPEITELINELSIFEYEITSAGNTRLNAPDGYHDDCVNALALACIGLVPTRMNVDLGVY